MRIPPPSSMIAYPAWQFLPLVKDILRHLTQQDPDGLSQVTYTDHVRHLQLLAATTLIIERDRLSVDIVAHSAINDDQVLDPLLGSGNWIVLTMTGSMSAAERDYLARFTERTGGLLKFEGGEWRRPQKVSDLKGIEGRKLQLMHLIGIEHANAIEAMLRHKEISVVLTKTPIRYPSRANDCSFGSGMCL